MNFCWLNSSLYGPHHWICHFFTGLQLQSLQVIYFRLSATSCLRLLLFFGQDVGLVDVQRWNVLTSAEGKKKKKVSPISMAFALPEVFLKKSASQDPTFPQTGSEPRRCDRGTSRCWLIKTNWRHVELRAADTHRAVAGVQPVEVASSWHLRSSGSEMRNANVAK